MTKKLTIFSRFYGKNITIKQNRVRKSKAFRTNRARKSKAFRTKSRSRKLKVRGINEIDCWPQRNRKEINEIEESKKRLMKRREQ